MASSRRSGAFDKRFSFLLLQVLSFFRPFAKFPSPLRTLPFPGFPFPLEDVRPGDGDTSRIVPLRHPTCTPPLRFLGLFSINAIIDSARLVERSCLLFIDGGEVL